jgi:cardiolipin synthase
MRLLSLSLVCSLVLSISGCSSLPVKREPAASGNSVTFFSTPEDLHRTWLNTINQAQSSILMEMFHLTDLEIVQALRAKPSQVQINLILDSGNLKDAGTEKIAQEILADRPNIHLYPSSGPPAGFTQTHTKSMVVDGTTALITSINLTGNAAAQRDYGVVSHDPDIISEMTLVFQADIQNSINAQSQQQPVRFTPNGVGQGNLIWSPINSEARLVDLIRQATRIPNGPQKFLYATVENLGDAPIENALSQAAQGGVQVRIIVPQCVLGSNGSRNYTFFPRLKNGVQYRVMAHPSSAQVQYMHGKMIILGDGHAYVGSVNYSKNSTHDNRELGIIFRDSDVTAQIKAIFDQDWAQAQDVPDPSILPTCPTDASDPTQ